MTVCVMLEKNVIYNKSCEFNNDKHKQNATLNIGIECVYMHSNKANIYCTSLLN